MLNKKIVLATHNLHKQKEMNSILSSLGILIVGLDDFPQIGDIEETGSTLHENALIKARTVIKLTGNPSLADDTGLRGGCLAWCTRCVFCSLCWTIIHHMKII